MGINTSSNFGRAFVVVLLFSLLMVSCDSRASRPPNEVTSISPTGRASPVARTTAQADPTPTTITAAAPVVTPTVTAIESTKLARAATDPFGAMLEYRAKSDKAVYRPGDLVGINFTIANTTTRSITFFQLPPAFTIRGRHVPFVFVSQRGSESVALPPGHSYTHRFEWAQKTSSRPGETASPGIYQFEMEPLEIEHEGSRSRTPAPTWLTTFVIQHPEGDLEKNLSPKLTMTQNGIAITLESIEMSASETKITIRALPPGYAYDQQLTFSRQAFGFYASASYRLDGNSFIELPTPAVGAKETGAINVWSGLDPVSTAAEQFTFVVNSFGGRKGPWIFTVPLRQ